MYAYTCVGTFGARFVVLFLAAFLPALPVFAAAVAAVQRHLSSLAFTRVARYSTYVARLYFAQPGAVYSYSHYPSLLVSTTCPPRCAVEAL